MKRIANTKIELPTHGQRIKLAYTRFSRLTISDNYICIVRCKILFYSRYFVPDLLNTVEVAKLRENLVL